jgi:gas vesicle protein
MSSGKVFLGLLAGLAAGALVGILFAPEKGSVTRKKMSKKTEDFTDGLKEKFNEFLDDISEKFEEVKEGVSDFTEQSDKSEKTKKDVTAAKG